MKKFYSTVVDGFLKGEFAGVRISMETSLFGEFLNGDIVIGLRPGLMYQGLEYNPDPVATDGMLYRKIDMIRYCRLYAPNSKDNENDLLVNHEVYDINSFLKFFRVSDVCLKEDKVILYFIDRRFPTARIIDLDWTSELVNGYFDDSKFYALELAEGGLFKEWCLSK